MSKATTVNTKGQVTIPQEVRDKLGIKPGHKATVTSYSTETNEVTLKISDKANSIEELAGSLHIPGMKYVPLEEVRKVAGYMLGEKYQLKSKK